MLRRHYHLPNCDLGPPTSWSMVQYFSFCLGSRFNLIWCVGVETYYVSGGRRNQPAPKCTGPILQLWAQKLFTNQILTKTIKHLDIAPVQLSMMQEVSEREHSFPKMMLIMMMTVMTTTTTTMMMVMQKWSGLCFLICCTSIQALGNAITKKLMQTTNSLQSYT